MEAGLYEQIVSDRLAQTLEDIPNGQKALAGLDEAEAAKSLGQYVGALVEKAMDVVLEKEKDVAAQLALVNDVITLLYDKVQAPALDLAQVATPAQQLLALLDEKDARLVLDKNAAANMPRPESSVAQSSLFTGARNEPQLFSEIKKEIASADSIDMLVSFIKWGGLRLIINELRDFTWRGGHLRVITTSYMGATEVKAVEALRTLPNTEVKVSYDTKRTRLHAKTYVFYRNTGFTTAYVGSSNLSNAAMTSGLEWNIKVAQHDQAEIIAKIAASFECYWHDKEFEAYTKNDIKRLDGALREEKYPGNGERDNIFTMDIAPYGYQQQILDKLEAERRVHGAYRNLVVAATGTGKTVISAFDYKRFCADNAGAPCRLLFVAHREEILKQSLNTFRAILKDANFGELYVGGYKPASSDHLFISVQTFNAQRLQEKTAADYYDYIIVDEFHHAAALTYQALLSYYQPKILLGLTATPERMDGKSILGYFGHRVAAEIRLPEAIERKLLCPFQYFGVSDEVDLSTLKWQRGGYDKSELSNLYSFSGAVANKRADHVVSSLEKYVTDIDKVKGLGFCVSVDHAKFMSDYFNECHIPSMYLSAQSRDEERRSAKERLVKGEIRFIFVIDLYNEGVDIPEVNTILFLRPTESLTIFLQQLGRGLRLADNKECLTVLDFIGAANKKYRFEEKFSALLADNRHSVAYEIKNGFVSVPKGCYIQLEKIAQRHILENIKAQLGNKKGLVLRLATFEEDSGLELTLANFLNYYHMSAKALYKSATFSHLCALAEVRAPFREPLEDTMTAAALQKAFARMASIDSRRWLQFLLKYLPRFAVLDANALAPIEVRMLQMFYVTLFGEVATDWQNEQVQGNIQALCESPLLLEEMQALLQHQYEQIDFTDSPVEVGFDCPLDLHCTYTRDQILVAMDFMKPQTVREGVKWLADKNTDVLFVTLNKSEKDYSPTTMYDDYSISDTLFHWQSQSTTSASSKTGQRYIHQRENGTRVLLFVREYKTDAENTSLAGGYTYLGRAIYVSHQGSSPMNVVWRLDEAIPAKYLKKTNKLVVG